MPGPSDSAYRERMRRKLLGLEERSVRKSYYPELQARLQQLEEQERRYHALFDGTFQLSGTVSCDGILTDANRSALEMVNARLEDVVGQPFVDTPWWAHSSDGRQQLLDGIAAAAKGEFVRFETSHLDVDGKIHYIDFSLTPVLHPAGSVDYLIAEGRDVSDYELASRELVQLKNLYAILSEVNAAILHAENEDALLQEICDIAVRQEEIKLAWVGFAKQDSSRVEPLAWAGEALSAIHEFFLNDEPDGDAEQRMVHSEDTSMVVEDLLAAAEFAPWTNIFDRYGLRSMSAFPLMRSGKASGILVVYANVPGYFQKDRVVLFEELAANTSHALDSFLREKERQEVEAALVESEARYRELVENANSIILRLNRAGEITFFNEYAESFFGFSRDEVLGRSAWETVVPPVDDSGRNLRTMMDQLLADPEAFAYNVNQNVCRDGRRVWVAWTNKVVLNEVGEIEEILSIGHDITQQRSQSDLIERKASEEKIRNALLQLALEPHPLQDYLDRSLKEIIQAPWLNLIPKGAIFLASEDGQSIHLAADFHFSREQREKCAEIKLGECICGRVALERQGYVGEHPATRDKAAHIHYTLPLVAAEQLLGVLNLSFPAGRDEEEHAENFLDGVVDILAVGISRRQSEVALREHDALLQRLIDTIPIPIYYKDTGLVYQGCNDYFARDILNRPKEEIVGKNMYDIAPKDLARVYEDTDLELLSTRRSLVQPTEVCYADGQRRSVIIHKAVITREDGAPYGIVGAILDISEHQKLEEQLRHSQKVEALGTLTGGIAHDFNNILTAIMGFASILQLKMPPGHEMDHIVDQILNASEKAANLTYSLLTYSRRQVAKPKPININQTVDDIEKILRRVLPETIVFETDLVAFKPYVMADQPQLEQVLVNLATNARDAMPLGGRLKIATEAIVVDDEFIRRHGFGAPGHYVLLSIQDTGEGIEPEILERIFDPFFTTKQVGRGTGLGLSITYGIVRQHRGHIQVESTPGEGATFSIYLPQTDQVEQAGQHASLRQPVGGKELLLVVEDDDSVRQVTKAVLEQVGYRVLTAEDGVEAVEIFSREGSNIDLVLTDIIMPRMTGLEMYQQVRQMRPDLKILFTSGYTFDALEDHGIDENEIDIIFKPVAPLELLGRIRELLDG